MGAESRISASAYLMKAMGVWDTRAALLYVRAASRWERLRERSYAAGFTTALSNWGRSRINTDQ